MTERPAGLGSQASVDLTLPGMGLSVTTRPDPVLDAVAAGVLVVDVFGRVTEVNPTACRLLDVAAADLLGAPPDVPLPAVRRLDGRPLPPADRPWTRAARTGQPPPDLHVVVAAADAAPRRVQLTTLPLTAQGRTVGAVTTLTDVTADRHREQTLRRTQEQFRLVMEHTPIGFAVVDLDGRFLRVNRALCHLLGHHGDELRERTLADVLHPDDANDVVHQIRRMLRGERDHVEVEARCLRGTGETLRTLASITTAVDADDGTQHLLVQIQDVTENRRAQDLLAHLALHDALTGLPNRTLVLNRIQKALDRGQRTGHHVAVLFCDLDHFKVVNDSMGHELGDAVLVEVARRLADALRGGDTAGRLGGDEFVVVCEDVTDEREAIVVAERIQAAVAAPAQVGGRTVVPTMSIGIAVSGTADVAPLTLLRDADTAMYRAKDHGRDRWDVVDLALRRRALDRLDLEHALRAGLEEDRLQVFYQPIVDLGTGALVGREALLRWRHPERGLLAPAEFLHVAEESGLIVEIGRWVLAQATRAAAASDAAGYVAVNVSATQVTRPGLAEAAAAALDAVGLAPHRLVVELTESVMLSAAPAARHELAALDELGVRLVVDDFGTGFSALSYLRDLPVSGIKVDRTFTAGLGLDDQCDRIVEALNALGHSLGLTVVVEGVETPAQRDALRTLGCRTAQGYLFGTPSPHYR